MSTERVYLVTGAASGIGAATVELLNAQGHRTIGVDLRGTDVEADLGTPAGREALVAGVARATDRVDGVIACAGVGVPSQLSVAVNFFGMVASLELVRPMLAESAAPRAVGIASFAAVHAVDEELVELQLDGDEPAALARATVLAEDPEVAGLIYGSTKRAFAQWIRRAAPTPGWAGAGIPLNCIAPGIVLTPMTTPLLQTKWRDDVRTGVPMPLNGMMAPEIPAHLLAFLASEWNSHICGQVIFVDSGAEVTLRGPATVDGHHHTRSSWAGCQNR